MHDERDPDDGSSPDTPVDPAGRFAVRRVVRPPETEPTTRQASSDETELGWGDAPGERDDDWYRRERPPHHG